MSDSIDINTIKKLTGGDGFYKRSESSPEPINIGPIMTLTGGDSFYRRDLDVDLTRNLTGPVKPQPRQPLAGRTNNNEGLRLGELERNTNIEYGANIFSKEILIDIADEY